MQNYFVLVTGAGGMIGRRLVPALIEEGHHVIAASRKRIDEFSGIEDHVQGDLLDEKVRSRALQGLFRHKENSVVIHLAGLNNVAACRSNAGDAFNENTILTLRILESMKSSGVKRLLFASTGHVYGQTGTAPVAETALPHPFSIYAASKLAAEALMEVYAKEAAFACEILRFSNVYGPESPEETAVGTVLSQVAGGAKNISVADPFPIRDFIYIDDAVHAMRLLLRQELCPGCRVTNVSTGTATSIGQLVNEALVAGGGVPQSFNNIVSEDRLLLSNAVLKTRTGWSPRYSLSAGLKACLQETKKGLLREK